MIMAPSWVSKGAPFQGTLFRKTSRGSPLHYPSLGSLTEKLKRTNLFQQKSRKVITYLTWVKVVLPYCYLILLGFPFFHKTVKTPRPLGSASERRTREDLKRAGGFHGGFDGSTEGGGFFGAAHGSTLAISENYPFFGRLFMARLEASKNQLILRLLVATFGYLWIREIPVQEADITKTIQTIRKCTGYSKQIDQNVPKINLI